MTRRARVPLLDRGHAGLDETVEQSLDRFEKVLVVERDRGLACDRLDHLEIVGPEAHDLGVDVLDRELGLKQSLGVDQLHRAGDLTVVVAHWDREHRLRAVAELRIEAPAPDRLARRDRKSTRLNSSHRTISYAV